MENSQDISQKANAVFCYACRHYVIAGHDAYRTRGMQNFAHGKKKIEDHNASEQHKSAMVKWQMAEKVKSSAIQSVASSITAAHKQAIDDNRHYIICIIRCILLCALQGIALRGHREQVDDDNPTLNRGNFLAIVSLTGVYDDVVRKRLDSGPQNAKYVHHDIQNDILSSASSLVRQLIVAQVVEAGVYAVMADETRDT
ncbi:Zinc finger MYM-type protein 1-like [Oopsacas minuta]|uniref:Zinc finger MYM-type protein 1-like n=1 Tax=Oopsacas minuta TaxID=111878 RepID=A0AAV7KH05_9METZ|nr:Zinc finger MYM-type protein 1-like [Oopsacas minuta]